MKAAASDRTMRIGVAALAALALVLTPSVVSGAPPAFTPGSPGIGDPYYPQDGNGGYDARHYDLDIAYYPGTNRVIGTVSMAATATQDLSRFNLDLDGLTVRSVIVNGRPARWARTGDELQITPTMGLAKGNPFRAVIQYDGVPRTLNEGGFGGFFHTDDGALVAGQPHGAATWFPVNDHPLDKASYTFRIEAPNDLQVLTNGNLVGKVISGGRTTWTWAAREPMASYLTTLAIGGYRTRSYSTATGVKVVDAVDTDLFTPFASPATGSRFAVSGATGAGYQRLARTLSVPAGGGTLSFALDRDIEPDYDFVLVEAHTVGAQDWTTLPDRNGNTSRSVGDLCSYGWTPQFHPFVRRYFTVQPGGTCRPTGSSGEWHAATGASDGYQNWEVDLAAYAGKQVEVAITYLTDDVVQGQGVVVDDVVTSWGAGSTSFEADDAPLDGWRVPGPPAGSPGNATDWAAGTADLIRTTGSVATASLRRQPEIVGFLSARFGPYPFSALGGIVTDDRRLNFALETQTRPVYSPAFFGDQQGGDSVVVHELAHQWFGDSVSVKSWSNIWLNEGFATYAEWMWAEREGLVTAQEIFDSYASIPAESGFWSVVIGDPGPDDLFNGAVYDRGAMTLHALRNRLGTAAFFSLLKTWSNDNSDGNVEISQFVKLAEEVSGRKLDGFFDAWLFAGTKPAGIVPAPSAGLAPGDAQRWGPSAEHLRHKFGGHKH